MVSNTPEAHKELEKLKFNDKSVKVVQDKVPHQGPLGGILAGLEASSSFYSLAVACDMPFLNVKLLEHLISEAHDADIVIPESSDGPEPLHAIYSKNCLPFIDKKLAEGEHRIISFFDEVKVKYVSKERVAQFDPQFFSFCNLNTPEDLEKTKEIYLKLEDERE